VKVDDVPLEEFVLDCRALFGDDLLGVFLYGSAATEDFLPGVSDFNLGVVLRQVGAPELRRAAGKLRRWAKARITPPLFLDAEFIRRGAGVFPIEFEEIKASHRMLYGSDPFLDLPVPRENLRLQCEYEIRSKLLRVRQAYLERAASSAEILELSQESLKSILLVLRNFLRFMGESPPQRLPSVIERVEARWGLALPTLHRVLALRAGSERVKRAEIHTLFEAYLGELQAIADGLPGALEGESSL
jgi:predicted nucleotidyltransferase